MMLDAVLSGLGAGLEWSIGDADRKIDDRMKTVFAELETGDKEMANRIELDIQHRRPFAEGVSFGAAGSYERLDGKARFAVDPNGSAQIGVVDLDKAPKNSDGLVEFEADISIIKPVDPSKANNRLLFDYGNRGNMRAIQFFNDAPASNDPITAAHAGNGYLMRRDT